MPTLSSMQIPPPANWQEFEIITQSALKIRWESPNLQRNGRSGQAQAGVDIYGEDDLARQVGVQCKLRSDGDIDETVVAEEVKKAEGFVPKLDAYYVATTAPTDAKVQRAVRILSQQRVAAGGFPVGVLFWEDIIQDLVRNEAELRLHYPALQLTDGAPSGPGLMPLLDLAYNGTGFRHFMDLLFGEAGEMAQEDPEQFRMLGSTVKICANLAMAADDATQLSSALTKTAPLVLT